MTSKPILYIVIPCYNEEKVLPETEPLFLQTLRGMISDGKIAEESRVMFVNDGSKDATWELISKFAEEEEQIEGLCLSRNRGHQNALFAGLMTAKQYADITISIDCDGQDDMTAMTRMVDEYLGGSQIVYGVRSERKTDTVFKRATAQGFYKVMAAMGADVVYNHADYRLMSKEALEGLAQFKEVNLFLRGMAPLVGFRYSCVYYERAERITGETLPAAVAEFAEKIVTNDFPSDGLVLLMDEIAYGESLGRTAKFPRNAMAFKWEDEIAETVLEEVEWSASRTGLINPVAVFEPVELEGTTVSRASVHNVSIVEQLALGVGDHIQVYKANMIIPQIAENMTRSGTLPIPEECPVCHSATAIHEENGVKALFCENASCPAKKIKSFSHFVSRDAMNIDGMSEATIEKLMNQDMIHEPADLFRLDRYKDQIIAMDGFGEKSYEKMVQSATRAAHTTIIRFLYSLGIPNVGLSNAGLICRYCAYDFDRVLAVSEEELTQIDGVGAVIAKAVTDYFAVEANRQVVQHLLQYITLEKIADDNVSKDMEGITFVITGSVEQFKNRKELKELIESHGGKVTGSVTSKTNYLINNDAMSNSTKNKKARELGIPILTEQAFIEQYHLS